jgi:3-hydroxybutyryl-CoA dehydrogenase
MDIKTVGIVGCGIMGRGIAQVSAQYGYNVVALDTNESLVTRGIASIEASLKRNVERGKLSAQDRDAALSRIKGTTKYADFSACDLIIEAVTEDMAVKKAVFTQLNNACPAHAIFATNTSVLCVAEIASATSKPDKVVGMHFSNPVHVTRILEIINTIATSAETIADAKHFGESIGKTPVITKDLPGFISNRIATSFYINAVKLVQEGVASAQDIDTVFKLGAGHPMGPLEILDLIGLDTVYRGASAMYEELKDPQYAPPPLMKRMVELGWLGRKTGKGFYDYSDSPK